MRAIIIIAIAAAVAGCSGSSTDDAGASVTVKLPPARPYAPNAAFSFGAAPRQPQGSLQ